MATNRSHFYSRFIAASQILIPLVVVGMVFAFKSSSSGTAQDWSVDPRGQIVVGRTPLMNAILASDQSQAQALLARNPFEINAQDSLGWSPLLCACFVGNSQMASALVEKGADVNVGNRIGKTPLIYAIQSGDSSIAPLLLSHGAQTNTPDDSGATPLMWAASTDDIAAVKALIAKHAGIDHKDKRGFDPLAVATLSDNVDVAALLIKNGADVNIKIAQDCNSTPLIYAINNHDELLAQDLISAHADVNAHTLDGFTPLMLAGQEGLDGTLISLLVAGAHPNGSLTDGMTALAFACASPKCTLAITQDLVNAGARVNGDAHDNGTPLMYAANGGHEDIVKYLISKGADPNYVTNRGMTALHWADGEGYQTSIGAELRKAGEQF